MNVGNLICGSSALSKSNYFLKIIWTIIILQNRNILGNQVAIKLEINNKIRKQRNNILSQENFWSYLFKKKTCIKEEQN